MRLVWGKGHSPGIRSFPTSAGRVPQLPLCLDLRAREDVEKSVIAFVARVLVQRLIAPRHGHLCAPGFRPRC